MGIIKSKQSKNLSANITGKKKLRNGHKIDNKFSIEIASSEEDHPIRIGFLGENTNEMRTIINIFIKDKIYEYEYEDYHRVSYNVYDKNIKLYIGVLINHVYGCGSNTCSRYRGWDILIMTDDLTNSHFVNNINRELIRIERYSDRCTYKMIVGFNYDSTNYWSKQRLVICGYDRLLNNDSIFRMLPKEIIYRILWIIHQHYYLLEQIKRFSNDQNIPFMPVSTKTGYNIEKIFTKIIEEFSYESSSVSS